MKIIAVDNFDRKRVSDTLIAENVSKYYAPVIADLLNKELGGEHTPFYYRAAIDNYVLYEFKP